MNKKLIRLTESDLHRIVRESVNKVLNEARLNELAPRTYASAAGKASLLGQKERAKKFNDATMDPWNDKYRNEKEGWESILRNDGLFRSGGPLRVQTSKIDDDDEMITTYYPKTDERTVGLGQQPPFRGIPLTKGEKVARQIVQGGGKYIKGKGWED